MELLEHIKEEKERVTENPDAKNSEIACMAFPMPRGTMGGKKKGKGGVGGSERARGKGGGRGKARKTEEILGSI